MVNKIKNVVIDICIVILTGLLLVISVGWVSSHISENMGPHVATVIIDFLIPYSNFITWYDILALFFAWICGVFFNKSLHRLIDNIY